MVPVITATLGAEPLTFGKIAALEFKEITVGVVIGLVLGVPFWAAEAAGDILDLQRGSSLATVVDPNSTTETSITGTMLGLIIVALYYVSGGLFMTLRALYASYDIWPISRFLPLFGPNAGQLLLGLLDEIITMGLMLVVPIVICLFLADILLALVSRAAPHFNIFALSLAVKNLVFATLLVLYSGFLASYVSRDLTTLLGASRWLETLGKPQAPNIQTVGEVASTHSTCRISATGVEALFEGYHITERATVGRSQPLPFIIQADRCHS
jgi:type III secretion protein T